MMRTNSSMTKPSAIQWNSSRLTWCRQTMVGTSNPYSSESPRVGQFARQTRTVRTRRLLIQPRRINPCSFLTEGYPGKALTLRGIGGMGSDFRDRRSPPLLHASNSAARIWSVIVGEPEANGQPTPEEPPKDRPIRVPEKISEIHATFNEMLGHTYNEETTTQTDDQNDDPNDHTSGLHFDSRTRRLPECREASALRSSSVGPKLATDLVGISSTMTQYFTEIYGS